MPVVSGLSAELEGPGNRHDVASRRRGDQLDPRPEREHRRITSTHLHPAIATRPRCSKENRRHPPWRENVSIP